MLRKKIRFSVLYIYCAFFLGSTSNVVAKPPNIELIRNYDCDNYRQSYLAEAKNKSKLSKLFNKFGFRAYKKNDMTLAASLFRCAFLEDDNNYLAHYNYASVFAIFNSQNADFCNSVYLVESMKHLGASINLNENRRVRVKKDSDFNSVRDDYEYKLLTINPNASAAFILTTMKTWFGPQQGIHGTSRLIFLDNQVVKWRVFETGKAGEIGKWSKTILGKYRIKDNKLYINFEEYKIDHLEGEILLVKKNNIIKEAKLKFKDFYQHLPFMDNCNI